MWDLRYAISDMRFGTPEAGYQIAVESAVATPPLARRRSGRGGVGPAAPEASLSIARSVAASKGPGVEVPGSLELGRGASEESRHAASCSSPKARIPHLTPNSKQQTAKAPHPTSRIAYLGSRILHPASCIPHLTALLVLASLWGCASKPADSYTPKPVETIPPATITPGNESSVLPLDKGNQWTYDASTVIAQNGQPQPGTNFEVTWTVTASQQTPNGTVATIVTTQDGKTKGSQDWLVNSKGVYELSDGTPPLKFDPPLPVLLFPAKPDTTFKYKGGGPTGFGDMGTHESDNTILASEIVDTSMGQISTIPIESKGTVVSKGITAHNAVSVYFSPGIGIVRMRQEAVAGGKGYIVLLKLKSKSLMKS